VDRKHFWGWSRSGLDDSKPNSEKTLPLIPPNQDLTITVASPLTARDDPLGPVIQQQQPPVALDPAIKAVWYTVDVSGTLPDEARQVIFEQGAAFAYRYNWDSSNTLRLWVTWLKLLFLAMQINPGVTQFNQARALDEQALHLGYSYLRWFLDSGTPPNPFSAQVPTGDYAPPIGISLESS